MIEADGLTETGIAALLSELYKNTGLIIPDDHENARPIYIPSMHKRDLHFLFDVGFLFLETV